MKRYRDQFAAQASEHASWAAAYRAAEKLSREWACQDESLYAMTLSLLDMPLRTVENREFSRRKPRPKSSNEPPKCDTKRRSSPTMLCITMHSKKSTCSLRAALAFRGARPSATRAERAGVYWERAKIIIEPWLLMKKLFATNLGQRPHRTTSRGFFRPFRMRRFVTESEPSNWPHARVRADRPRIHGSSRYTCRCLRGERRLQRRGRDATKGDGVASRGTPQRSRLLARLEGYEAKQPFRANRSKGILTSD